MRGSQHASALPIAKLRAGLGMHLSSITEGYIVMLKGC